MVLIEDIDEDSPPEPDDISVTSAADAFGSGEAADAAPAESEEPKLTAAERTELRKSIQSNHIHSRVGSNLHQKLLEVPATARRMKDPGFLQMVNNVQVPLTSVCTNQTLARRRTQCFWMPTSEWETHAQCRSWPR